MHARPFLLAILALGVAASAGAAYAAIWLGLTIFAEQAVALMREAAATRDGASTQRWTREAHDAVNAAAIAAAPALMWFSRVEFAAPLALIMLGAAFSTSTYAAAARRLSVSAPFAAVGFLFVCDALLAGAFAPALMLLTALAYGGAHIAHRAVRADRLARDARAHTEHHIEHLNTSLSDDVAVWEIDFTHNGIAGGNMNGAEHLSALLGQPVNEQRLREEACFAAPEDRDLAAAMFQSLPGPARRIAIEHDIVTPEGGRRRVRHEGVVHAAHDGEPARFTCLSRRVEQNSETVEKAKPAATPQEALLAAARNAGAALASQTEALRTLANELHDNQAQPNIRLAALLAQADGSAYSFDVVATLLEDLASRSAQIERSVDALAHARHAADAANLAKSQFLANMSHELRTPLNAIIGYAEILQEDAEDEGNSAAVQDTNRILTAARHLLSLINEILDLSKIEAGRMEVSAAPFEPCEMLDEIVDTVQPLIQKNDNALKVNGEMQTGSANTDATKLRQCLLNLLSNAAKFTRNGEIEISFERRAVDGVDHLCFTVRDTGIGMSPDQMARLFQPFVQADPTITQQYGGTGLGLTITHRFVELMGGSVDVQSKPNAGSTFTLRVPAVFRAVSASAGVVDPLQGEENAPLVIVIEDEEDARELVARSLTRVGYSVLGVGGGDTGLTLARAKAPALVVLDIFLPDRSGWRVLQSLKNDPKTCDIPVLVVSVSDDRPHALSLGAADHFTKPVDRDVLASAVMRYARKRAGAAPAASAPAVSAPALAETRTREAG